MPKIDKLHNMFRDKIHNSLPKVKEIDVNFDTTDDGGIDVPDSYTGMEHALKFAQWAGYNEALQDVFESIEITLENIFMKDIQDLIAQAETEARIDELRGVAKVADTTEMHRKAYDFAFMRLAQLRNEDD